MYRANALKEILLGVIMDTITKEMHICNTITSAGLII
jgi:hypothetical protein